MNKLPDKYKRWVLDRSATDLQNSPPTFFQYRRQICGDSFTIYVEMDRDVYAGIFHKPSKIIQSKCGSTYTEHIENPHKEPIDRFYEANTISDALEQCKQWMSPEYAEYIGSMQSSL
jgi:hypothetical protein